MHDQKIQLILWVFSPLDIFEVKFINNEVSLFCCFIRGIYMFIILSLPGLTNLTVYFFFVFIIILFGLIQISNNTIVKTRLQGLVQYILIFNKSILNNTSSVNTNQHIHFPIFFLI